VTDLGGIANQLVPLLKNIIAGMLRQSDSGLIGGMREAGAIATYLKEAETKFAGNAIIEQVSSTLLTGGDIDLPDLMDINLSDVLRDVGNLTEVLHTLPGGDQVRTFVYELAERVAGAAGGGLFGGGQKVSAGEQQMLAALRAQLGLAPPSA